MVNSADGRLHFVYQGDGNLVLYFGTGTSGWEPLWATDTDGTSPGFVTMQGDGNLVVYNRSGRPGLVQRHVSGRVVARRAERRQRRDLQPEWQRRCGPPTRSWTESMPSFIACCRDALAVAGWLAAWMPAAGPAVAQPAREVPAEIVWHVPGEGRGTPALLGHTAFFLSKHHELVALDVRSGQVRWRRETRTVPARPRRGQPSWSRRRTVIAGDGGLVAFTHAGVERWRFAPENGGNAGVYLGESAGGVAARRVVRWPALGAGCRVGSRCAGRSTSARDVAPPYLRQSWPTGSSLACLYRVRRPSRRAGSLPRISRRAANSGVGRLAFAGGPLAAGCARPGC